MSSFMTRPLFPLPCTVEMSMLLALAMARTAGVARALPQCQASVRSHGTANLDHLYFRERNWSFV